MENALVSSRSRTTNLLLGVAKPGQYLGNEVNAVHKDFDQAKLRIALVFPDAYEIGMSHMGLKILYDILNNIEGVVAERCFAPGLDLEANLRAADAPLFSLESQRPLNEFDVIGISLSYELTYTNALNILDLAKIPLWQKDRTATHPIILAGGTCAYNPEPLADFFDAVAIGDSEELILEFVDRMLAWKHTNKTTGKAGILDQLSQIEGMYIPSFFTPEYHADGTLAKMQPLKPGYDSVKKRVVADLNAQPYPTKLIIPNVKLVHDRIGIEIQRGCTRMCRFCQAGYIERPTRQRSPERVLEIAEASYQQTGIDEISLLSLSAGDYATIVPTLKELNARYADRNVAISVPATRTETLTPELIEQIKQVRMSGFTIAPEAGSERMRRVINKGNKVENLMQAARNAFSAGYRLIKFYYMCGLPFEHDEDVIGIANESYQALKIGQGYTRNVQINVSVSSFVPKPFTPFQWEPQMSIEETKRRHRLVKENLRDKRLNFKHHHPEMSYLEGLLARGDRRLAPVLLQALRNGSRFDEWSEHFRFEYWQRAFEQTGIDPDFYVQRRRSKDEVFPWDHLFSQMDKNWLWKEYEGAAQEAYVADCSIEKCADFCGACDFKTFKNRVYVIDDKPLAVKKGNREWYGRFGADTAVPSWRPESTKNDTSPNCQYRYRLHFTKTEMAAYMGHLELMTALKRAILRSGSTPAYSQGFHPQMKLSMGPALPLGVESTCESCEIVLTELVKTDDFINKINICLPDGLRVVNAEFVDLHGPSIYSLTQRIFYEVRLPENLTVQDRTVLQNSISELMSGKEMIFTRAPLRDKPAKTFILNQHLSLPDSPLNGNQLAFSTICSDSGSLSPREIVAALTQGKLGSTAHVQVKKVGVSLKPPATKQAPQTETSRQR